MSNSFAHDDTGAFQGPAAPSCQWSFNRLHEFHHIGGDSAGLFDRLPTDLSRRHVSIIDDSLGTWSARLDRMFQGEASIEQSGATGPAGEYAVFHIPVRTAGGTVRYVAGFAFPAGSPLPGAAELESAAATTLRALESERTRTTRFLHDVVAQSLSGTGFHLELLQLEIQAQSAEALKRAAEIQKSLEEVLKLIREFNVPE